MNMKKKYIASAAALALILAAGWGIRAYRESRLPGSHGQHAATYYCPMHPSYTSDKPGDCPICNMKLVPMEKSGMPVSSGKKMCVLHNCKMANCKMELTLKPGEKVTCPICGTHVAEAAEPAAGGILYYRHPMRPEVTSPTPKKDEMGMDYVPVYAEEEKTEVPVPGQATTRVSPEGRQLIGMKTEVLQRRALAATVRASGRVAYDPDLYNALTEYREAVRARDKVKDSPWPDVLERAGALVRASFLRLRQMGLSEAQIEESGRSEQSPTNLILGGAGGAVWVYAQIYEYEIDMVRPGQTAEITSPAFRGRKFRGVVKAVDPILSAETRSLKVRIEVPNPENLLKLEMFVNALIRADLGTKLALPESALLNTGERQLVFVDLGEGRIEPREVEIGREAGGYYELLSGAREGEQVVTSANFLIDSESKLKSALPESEGKKSGKALKEAAPQSEHRH
ncbi:MAG: efflux RND transporter periplasmic adaptor subunit [Elusimicrobiota bacterium]|nr:efflux RND transporter periplasmic adaptor subunit [Elusimicrobiota bacterium]